MTGLWEDVRLGLRVLRKSPSFTAAAVIVLGLGIGANTAIFSFLNALFLRPFPFHDLDTLVTVWETHPQAGSQADAAHASSGRRYPVPPGDFLDWRKSQSFSRFAAYRYRELNLTETDEPMRLRGVVVTSDFFPALGVQPAMGRTIRPEEEISGSDDTAVLSHALWRDRFGSDPAILGKTCTLNGRKHTVVGVMPADFEFPLGGVKIWLPLAMTTAEMTERGTRNFQTVARLKEGTTLRQAQAEMDGITARLAQEYPETNAGRGATLVPLTEQQVGFTTSFALLFQAAAAFVLLITCANMANLLLARSGSRQREVAVRAALGASRWRVSRQLLVESLLLALGGGLLAVWLARQGVSLIRASVPEDIVQWVAGWSAIRVDGRVLLFTLTLAVLTSLVFGIVPARQAARAELAGLLREGRGSAPRGRNRLRALLVVSELTLALVLLVGAGLLVKGFVGLLNVYQGFEPAGVMTLRIALPEEKYSKPQAAQFYATLLERLEAQPGVESAALVSQIPGDLGPMPGGPFSIEGRPVLTKNDLPVSDFQVITPRYFETLRVTLRRGRAFGVQDGDGAPPVAIISDSMANRLWPGEEPLGRRVKLGAADAAGQWMEIVGVVSDVRQYWFDRDPRLTLYMPFAQAARLRTGVLIRGPGDASALATVARAQVASLDPNQPIFEAQTMDEGIRQSVAFVRMSAGLMVTLGVLALVLAAVGVYGVMAHHVSQRTHEIGIRLAIGAKTSEIMKLVVGQALKLTVIGLAIGVPLAFILSRLMANALFGVVRPDLPAMAAIMLVLMAVALVASYLPARKAASVDPLTALRNE